MPITIEVRKEEDILLSLDNITDAPESDTISSDDLPKDDEKKRAEKMNDQLRNLVEKTWNQYKIRLIAWSEEDHSWYMWTKA